MESLLRSNVAHLFIAAFFLLSAGCRIPTSWMGGGSRQPNIVLMMADDLGWADLGIQGHPFLRTPNIDAVAENGLRFTRFYSAAPVCSPTRGSVLTGRHPFRYGVFSANTHHLPEEEITLAEVLRDNGYRTGFFGKWHLGTLTVSERDGMRGGITSHTHFQPPARHGFHVSFATEAKVPTYDPMLMPEGQTRMVWWNPVGESHQTPESYGSAYWNTDDQKVVDNLGGDDSRVMMDRAIPFIKSAAQSNTPFLAVIWFHAPHLPLVSDSTSRAAYADMSPRAQLNCPA